MDLPDSPRGKWTVDFGWTMSAGDAALYEERFRRTSNQCASRTAAKRSGSISGGT